MGFSENHIAFEDSFAFGFFCLISLVSSFAKEETREMRRKEKKEERLPRRPVSLPPGGRWILRSKRRKEPAFREV